MFEDLKVKELKFATLFLKPEVYDKGIKIDYIGIEIPNKFIVGFGLDYNGLGRNCPEIYQLKDTVRILQNKLNNQTVYLQAVHQKIKNQ